MIFLTCSLTLSLIERKLNQNKEEEERDNKQNRICIYAYAPFLTNQEKTGLHTPENKTDINNLRTCGKIIEKNHPFVRLLF